MAATPLNDELSDQERKPELEHGLLPPQGRRFLWRRPQLLT